MGVRNQLPILRMAASERRAIRWSGAQEPAPLRISAAENRSAAPPGKAERDRSAGGQGMRLTSLRTHIHHRGWKRGPAQRGVNPSPALSSGSGTTAAGA